jgi:hypothetical protein
MYKVYSSFRMWEQEDKVIEFTAKNILKNSHKHKPILPTLLKTIA